MRVSLYQLVAGVVVMAAGASAARADFIAPDGVSYGWTRGVTAGSAYAQWEIFTTAAGPNAPDVGSFAGGTLAPSAPAWNVFDSSGASFVTSSGNIYSFSAPTNIHVIVPSFDAGATGTTTILLQVRTQGTEADPASFNIGGVAPDATTELARTGIIVDTLYRWELPGNASSYEVLFNASGSSMSVDRVAVDTFVNVPAPGAGVLMAIGGLVAIRRRR